MVQEKQSCIIASSSAQPKRTSGTRTGPPHHIAHSAPGTMHYYLHLASLPGQLKRFEPSSNPPTFHDIYSIDYVCFQGCHRYLRLQPFIYSPPTRTRQYEQGAAACLQGFFLHVPCIRCCIPPGCESECQAEADYCDCSQSLTRSKAPLKVTRSFPGLALITSPASGRSFIPLRVTLRLPHPSRPLPA